MNINNWKGKQYTYKIKQRFLETNIKKILLGKISKKFPSKFDRMVFLKYFNQ